jgi:hypothetical protein
VENKIVSAANVGFLREDPVDFKASSKITLEIGDKTR